MCNPRWMSALGCCRHSTANVRIGGDTFTIRNLCGKASKTALLTAMLSGSTYLITRLRTLVLTSAFSRMSFIASISVFRRSLLSISF